MKPKLIEVHIGNAIEKRIEELGITKTEFAKRAGIPQQHAYRVFERNTIETKKLMKICKVLDFNFFTLFCEGNDNTSAILSVLDILDTDKMFAGLTPDAIATQIMISKMKCQLAEERIALLNTMISRMDAQLADKKLIDTCKSEQIEMLKAQNARLQKELDNLK
jgi:DNA-binding Xre family transcriptional regulator